MQNLRVCNKLNINSLLRLNIGGLTVTYADDTAILFAGDTWESVRSQTIDGLTIVMNWLQCNKLSLNITKTNYVAFSLTAVNRPIFTSIELDNHSIKETSQTKYLGVVIERYIKWKPHVEYLSSKVRKLIHKFYLLREFLNRKTLITVYKAFVESVIGYGILVWGGLYNNSLNKLNIIQKYILKIMFKNDSTPLTCSLHRKCVTLEQFIC